jgi:hypothetical protein
MADKYRQDEGGSLILFILLLLAFALLIALPVLQLIIIEHRACIHEQIALQAHYLAEAGLAKAQQILCFNVDAPLLVGEQALGNGTFSLQRRPGRQIVAEGRVGSVTASLALDYEPLELSEGYLLCIGGADGEGHLGLSETARVQVAGSALVIGNLYADVGALLSVASELTLTGELLGEGTLEIPPSFVQNPLSEEMWIWLQQRLLQAGEPLPAPIGGVLRLASGRIYECSSADWSGLQVIGPSEGEPPATLIVRGDLHWQDFRGNINLLVTGDCNQTLEQAGNLAIDGVLWVQGALEVHSLHVRGALIAGSLQVHASPISGWNLVVEQYPGQTSGTGLVVPRFSFWRYLFD